MPKKKVVKVAEDTKSKKEHVNVVFIGHVGKLIHSFFLNSFSRFLNHQKVLCLFQHLTLFIIM